MTTTKVQTRKVCHDNTCKSMNTPLVSMWKDNPYKDDHLNDPVF